MLTSSSRPRPGVGCALIAFTDPSSIVMARALAEEFQRRGLLLPVLPERFIALLDELEWCRSAQGVRQ